MEYDDLLEFLGVDHLDDDVRDLLYEQSHLSQEELTDALVDGSLSPDDFSEKIQLSLDVIDSIEDYLDS